METISYANPDFTLHLGDPEVLIGLFIGGMIPFLIASITMTAVGDAAMDMIREIRRQFRDRDGVLAVLPGAVVAPDPRRLSRSGRHGKEWFVAGTAADVIGWQIGEEPLEMMKRIIARNRCGREALDAHPRLIPEDG